MYQCRFISGDRCTVLIQGYFTVPAGACESSLLSPGPLAPLPERSPVTPGIERRRSHLLGLCPTRRSKAQGPEARKLDMKFVSAQIYYGCVQVPFSPSARENNNPVSLGPWSAPEDPLRVLAPGQAAQLLLLVSTASCKAPKACCLQD